MRAAVEVMGEDGYEGASIRDMAARAGVSVAALYYHFPSKLDLLREFLDEAHDVTLARIERRLARPEHRRRLEVIVGTLIWSHLHDGFARRAAYVVSREYTRLPRPTGGDRGEAQGPARPRRGGRARRCGQAAVKTESHVKRHGRSSRWPVDVGVEREIAGRSRRSSPLPGLRALTLVR